VLIIHGLVDSRTAARSSNRVQWWGKSRRNRLLRTLY
jgi:hypothetical protein